MPRHPIHLLEPEETEDVLSNKDVSEQPPHLRLQLVSGMIIDLGGREQIVIGRQDPTVEPPGLDLTPFGAQEHGVSRHHARISYNDGQYTIEDLGSYNDTLLNGSRLLPGQQYPLKHGDVLQFGTLAVRVLI